MTKSRAAEVARQYEQGKSIDALIAEYKSSYFSVRKAIKENNVAMRQKSVTLKAARAKRSQKRWSEEDSRIAAEIYATSSLKDTAAAVGFAKAYTAKMLKENGVTLREPHKKIGSAPVVKQEPRKQQKKRVGNTTEKTAQKKYDFGKFQSMSMRPQV